MVKIGIGFDSHEIVAYHVLAQSILERSSVPVSFIPIHKPLLSGFYHRAKGPYDSTDFSISRFLTPYLCDFEGMSIFVDCDMLVLDDIKNLLDAVDDKYAVSVVKHDYSPSTKTKFLGQVQTEYRLKNWSSVMVFNNYRCKELTPEYVEKAPGLDLHQFVWCGEDMVGEIPKRWNWLVDEPGYDGCDASLLHYTKGTPCFDAYKDCGCSDLWHKEREVTNSSA